MRNIKTGAAPAEDSFLLRILAKTLGRFTFSMTGLRVDLQGSAVSVSSGTVTANAAPDYPVALGRANSTGTGIQLSQQAYNCGFRRNLSIT